MNQVLCFFLFFDFSSAYVFYHSGVVLYNWVNYIFLPTLHYPLSFRNQAQTLEKTGTISTKDEKILLPYFTVFIPCCLWAATMGTKRLHRLRPKKQPQQYHIRE